MGTDSWRTYPKVREHPLTTSFQTRSETFQLKRPPGRLLSVELQLAEQEKLVTQNRPT